MNDVLTKTEVVGRYLCKAYYNSELAQFELLRKCVEDVVSRSAIWLRLLSGDLAKLNSQQRVWQLGGGVFFRGIFWSIDGKEDCLRDREIAMYAAVGQAFVQLLV